MFNRWLLLERLGFRAASGSCDVNVHYLERLERDGRITLRRSSKVQESSEDMFGKKFLKTECRTSLSRF